jgi:NitT/TauT family transport system permease protein
MSKGQGLFVIRKNLQPGPKKILFTLSFVLPVLLWCVVSYVPFVWHPMISVTDKGDVAFFKEEMLVKKGVFYAENARMERSGKKLAEGYPANPIYLPAPHTVVISLVEAFTTPPRRASDPWLHESLAHSIRVIFFGFMLSSLFGVPIGIMCGTFRFFSNLIEPFIEYFRYLPAPVFGALAVAILGINDGPKIAIIFIGTFFQQVLVIANTTRKLDISLIEASQTLGANKLSIVRTVIIPGILPDLYRDMRILLGWAWTYLIVAEVIGASTGISWFINQQAKYRNFDEVFAAILIIGVIGVITDQILALIGKRLFHWEKQNESE